MYFISLQMYLVLWEWCETENGWHYSKLWSVGKKILSWSWKKLPKNCWPNLRSKAEIWLCFIVSCIKIWTVLKVKSQIIWVLKHVFQSSLAQCWSATSFPQMLNQVPGGELQLQVWRNLSQTPSSFENQLYFYQTESLDYLLEAGYSKDFFSSREKVWSKKMENSCRNGEIRVYGWNEC